MITEGCRAKHCGNATVLTSIRGNGLGQHSTARRGAAKVRHSITRRVALSQYGTQSSMKCHGAADHMISALLDLRFPLHSSTDYWPIRGLHETEVCTAWRGGALNWKTHETGTRRDLEQHPCFSGSCISSTDRGHAGWP